MSRVLVQGWSKEFLLFCGLLGFFVFEAIKAIHAFDNHKDNPGDDEELQDILDESTVTNFGGFASANPAWNGDGEVGKIDAATDEPNDWHNNVVDERIDDGGESAAHGNTYGEIDDGATIDKLDELFSKTAAFFFGFFGFCFDVFFVHKILSELFCF